MAEQSRRSMLDQIAQEARRNMTAIPLPKDGPVSRSDIDRVRDLLDRFLMRRSDWDVRRVADATGCTAGQISQFRSRGSPMPSHANMARVINEMIERVEQADQRDLERGFVETTNAREIITVAQIAVRRGKIGLVTGPSGMGKTVTAKAICKRDPTAIYIRVGVKAGSGSALMREIARALQLPVSIRAWSIYDRVRERLTGTNRLIIPDEAHHLKPDGLETLRDLHDDTGCPMLLLGTHDLDASIDDTKSQYGQMARRICARRDITAQTVGDEDTKETRPLYTVDEVAAFIQTLELGSIRLTTDAMDYLTMLACAAGFGGLSPVEDLVRDAAALKRDVVDERLLQSLYVALHGSRHTRAAMRRVEQLDYRRPDRRKVAAS